MSTDVRIFHKECASLAKAGYEVYLVAKGDSREEKGVHVVGVGEAPANRIKRMIGFTAAVYRKALELDADIYHIHDPELLPYGLKLKKHGKKVIFDSHENTLEQIEEKQWIPKLLRKPVSFAYKNYASSVFGKLDALISVTPHIVRQLEATNPKVSMVTNYPVLSDFNPQRRETDGVFRLCFTGGIDHQWSHGHIINTIGAMEGFRYVLCGRAKDAYMDSLCSLPGWEMVDYKGVVSHAQAELIQQSSDVGVALLKPSRNSHGMEGTIGNTKLFEYMMAGLPVICTDFQLWKAIIDKYDCGLYIDCEDGSGLKNALEILRADSERARRMGLNGRKAVEQEFNWSTQEKVLLELYAGL